MRRRIASVLALSLMIMVVSAALLPSGVGAAACGEKTLNVNLGQNCVTAAGVTLLSPAADTSACADAAGCADVSSAADAPSVVRTRPAPPAAAPHRPATVRNVAAPVPHFTYRVNKFDVAPGDSFYSGDFRVLLPYAAQPPAISPLPQRGSTFGTGWSVPRIPRELLIAIIGGLMLLASAGGARRIRATM